jgi:hypothetical protein
MTTADTLLSVFYDRGDGKMALQLNNPEYYTVSEMVRQANDDLGYDFSFQAVYEVLGTLSANDLTTRDAIEDEGYDLLADLVDIYTSQLTAWLAEDLKHLSLCDEAMGELGCFDTTETLIQCGQEYGYRYALAAVVQHWPENPDPDDEEEIEEEE